MSPVPASTVATPVLVVGAGPTGLITALNLARYGIECVLVDQNEVVGEWPKMDLTNRRSMELLRRMGLADEVRAQGVPPHHSLDVLFSGGFGESEADHKYLTKWSRASPAECSRLIVNRNDGSMSQEPYLRIMQSVFEKLLRRKCSEASNITMLFGAFDGLKESDDAVVSTLMLPGTGASTNVHSKYVVGCDGSKSRVRQAVGINMHGEQLPIKYFLVHFRSKDLKRIHCQGPFWHIFYISGGVLISQDEIDTWTIHQGFPLDVDPSTVNPMDVIFNVLGGLVGPYKVDVDEILVSGFWRPSTYIAHAYRSQQGRVFLAGDSVHQCIPTGGYGMNTGVGDGWDISWKIAAVLNGFGGEQLLRSYDIERRPVGLRNVARSGELMQVHLTYLEWIRSASEGCLLSADSEEGRVLREKIIRHVESHDTEVAEEGLELDFRFPDSPVVVSESTPQQPNWELLHYTPSTLPGHRAPYVVLSDGLTSTYDLHGPWYSIFDFSADGDAAGIFSNVAGELNIPLKLVNLPGESHVKRLWEREAVLIRPDGYVAWRSSATAGRVDENTAKAALLVAMGA